jgi:hypothetical protein
MNPARMLGRYSLNLATTLSATALVMLTAVSACSDDDPDATSKREDRSTREMDASSARESDTEASRKESDSEEHKESDTAVSDEAMKKAEPKAEAKPSGGEADFCNALTVMQSNCIVCHGSKPVAGAPMSLVKYEDFMQPSLSDPSRKVYELVKERTHDQKRPMPPAGMLSDDKLAPLEAWLAAGAPEAKEACPNKSITRSEPDKSWPKDCEDIYTVVAHDPDDSSKPFMIPPNSEIHPYIMVDAPWGDDEVQLLATRPITDNEASVHHWILWESKDRTNLTFWAPGATGDSFPDDVGLYMPKGKASMGLDMHYYNLNNDKPVYDRSGVQMCVTRKHKREKMATLYGLFGNATVPANQRVVNSTSCTVKGELHLLGVNPHMHRRGVHGHLDLRRGGMDPTEVLYDGPFSFEEQTMKPLKDTVIKEGDVFTTTCTFENMTDRNVAFGEGTDDEMCINWIRYYPKGGFSCRSMMAPADAPIDPNSTGNGDFPTGADLDAGVEPPAN